MYLSWCHLTCQHSYNQVFKSCLVSKHICTHCSDATKCVEVNKVGATNTGDHWEPATIQRFSGVVRKRQISIDDEFSILELSISKSIISDLAWLYRDFMQTQVLIKSEPSPPSVHPSDQHPFFISWVQKIDKHPFWNLKMVTDQDGRNCQVSKEPCFWHDGIFLIMYIFKCHEFFQKSKTLLSSRISIQLNSYYLHSFFFGYLQQDLWSVFSFSSLINCKIVNNKQ